MRFCLDDPQFLFEYPRLCNQLKMLNVRLRSYCLTGKSGSLEEDDCGYPRIFSADFDSKSAARIQNIFENTRIGRKPKQSVFIKIALEIDYGNGFSESRPFTLFQDDETALFRKIRVGKGMTRLHGENFQKKCHP